MLNSSAAALASATNTVAIGSAAEYRSVIPSSPSSYSVALGDKIFGYNSFHNLYLTPSEEAYSNCNFDGAAELASTGQGGGSGGTPNLYEAVVTAGSMLHLTCQMWDPIYVIANETFTTTHNCLTGCDADPDFQEIETSDNMGTVSVGHFDGMAKIPNDGKEFTSKTPPPDKELFLPAVETQLLPEAHLLTAVKMADGDGDGAIAC